MDAIKSGIDKAKEAMHGKEAQKDIHDATDPSKKPSDRIDAAHSAAKHDAKADEHGVKAEINADKHACSGGSCKRS